jgi:hypothetical protein
MAALPRAGDARIGDLVARLSHLERAFAENVVAATHDFTRRGSEDHGAIA